MFCPTNSRRAVASAVENDWRPPVSTLNVRRLPLSGTTIADDVRRSRPGPKTRNAGDARALVARARSALSSCACGLAARVTVVLEVTPLAITVAATAVVGTPMVYATGVSKIPLDRPPDANCGTMRYFAPPARSTKVPLVQASVAD